MPRLPRVLSDLVAVAAGFVTMAALGAGWLPPGLVAVAAALFVILVLPRRPRLVVAYVGGVALAMVLVLVIFLNPAWNTCADEVDGRVVEYRCSEGRLT